MPVNNLTISQSLQTLQNSAASTQQDIAQMQFEVFLDPIPQNIYVTLNDPVTGNPDTISIPNWAMMLQTVSNLTSQISGVNFSSLVSIDNLSSQLDNYALNSTNIAYSYETQINGDTTNYIVTHNLRKDLVSVTCYDNGTNWILPDNIVILNANQVQVSFEAPVSPSFIII
jgi:hypothetical protein